MSYEIGTYIDLSHLNQKAEAAPTAARKSSVQETVSNLVEVGTQILFNFAEKTEGQTRHIPIVFA